LSPVAVKITDTRASHCFESVRCDRATFVGVVAELEGQVVGDAPYHDGYETDRGRRLVPLIDL